MMSRDVQPAMLILSRAIYARRTDGTFYPGTIETKLRDGCYLVKFRDGTNEKVEEKSITWLGFWGLPPWIWPTNPVIQPAGLSDWDLLNGQSRNSNDKDCTPNSAHFRDFCETGDSIRQVNGAIKLDFKPGTDPHEKVKHEALCRPSYEHVLPKQASLDNQTRTSVLRMCPNGNLTLEDEETASKELESPTKHTDLELSDFNPIHSRSHSTSSIEDKKDLRFDKHRRFSLENDSPIKKKRLSSHVYDEPAIKEKCTKSDHVRESHQNSPPFHKHYPHSTTLPPLISSHLHNYGHPFAFSMYGPTSPPSPASFKLQTRTRRRSENKKCRKVYGIENRDIWCTQCKWKKACTRFAGSENSDMTRFMHVPNYEELHYTVS